MIGICIAVGVVCLLGGAIASFFITKSIFNKQLEKNPPINREMIRAMFMEMGRKPSEKDISRVINRMNQYSPEEKKKTVEEEKRVQSKKFIKNNKK